MEDNLIEEELFNMLKYKNIKFGRRINIEFDIESEMSPSEIEQLVMQIYKDRMIFGCRIKNLEVYASKVILKE